MDHQPLAVATGLGLPRSRTAPARKPALARPRAVLCDLDGTLIDTMPILADLATEVLVEVYGMPRSLGRELYLSTCGLPFIRQLDSICPGDARNGYASDLFEARKPAHCRRVRMPADTRQALVAMAAEGIRIVVSSNNGQDNVDAFAADAGFKFDLVLGYGDGAAKGKPHMDSVAHAFGLSRGDMLFVGDSLHDGEIAQDENVAFVGVASTFARERFALRFPGVPVVQRFGELAGLLGV